MAKKVLTALVLLVTAASSSAASLTVKCGGRGEEGFRSISAALAHLSPFGSNTVTVYGACNENVVIQGIDRLTLIAAPGASISDASAGNANVIDISDSQRVTIQGFTINGGADGVDCHNHSFCHFSGNTIQGSAGDGVSVRDSQADFSGDVLQNHAGAGLSVAIKGLVSIAFATLQGNAFGGADVADGASLEIYGNNTIKDNPGPGVFVTGGSRLRVFGGVITGNSGDGVGLADGSTATFVSFFSNVVISLNTGHGVSVGNLSFANFAPGITVSGNLPGPDVLCYAKFSATSGAQTNLGGGTTNCTDS